MAVLAVFFHLSSSGSQYYAIADLFSYLIIISSHFLFCNYKLYMDLMNVLSYDAFYLITSALCFQSISTIAYRYELIPSSVPIEKRHFWFNVLLSLVHSCYGSIAWLFCFALIPDYGFPSHLSAPGNNAERILLSIAIGYFVYDLGHTLRSFSLWNSKGLIFHHVWVIWGFHIFSLGMNRHNVAMVALASEINTIFIHVRKLLRLAQISKKSFLYRANGWLNIFTYFVFRFPAFGWMFLYLFLFTDFTQDIHYLFTTIGCFQMTLFNFVLFYKLVKSDYFRKNEKKSFKMTQKK